MDAASEVALAWFNLREPACNAAACPLCRPVSAELDVAVGYFTSPAALARHLRTTHGRIPRMMEVT